MSSKFSKPAGFEEKKKLEDKDILTKEDDQPKKEVQEKKPEEEEVQEKQNASERINLQHIMELREAFDIADADKGGALELDEFVDAFKEIIGKNMTPKQLNQLFMKIDADSNGSVEWPEFMNYMLLENQTLSLMKREHFEYIPSRKLDPQPNKVKLCHSDMITGMEFIFPDDFETMTPQQQKRFLKYATSSRDGTVKIWNAHSVLPEQTIQVTKDVWVTCLIYMKGSKKLVAASANRMISFYDLNSTQQNVPSSRFEDLVGIPLCMEYYKWPENNEKKYETLLVGLDLGICHMYNFKSDNWHSCVFRQGHFVQPPLTCHEDDIIKEFKSEIDKEFLEMEKKQKAEKQKIKDKKKIGNQVQGSQDNQNQNIDKTKETGQHKTFAAQRKKKVIAYQKKEWGIEVKEMLMHKSWITKIKYYPDLQYIISSSLDSLIHIHDIKDLSYKDKTFNLHQKGVNSFFYSQKHKFVASCGEERHIIIWNPYTRRVVTYLYGHNTSVQDLAMNEERHHLISLGTDKVVNIWDRTFTRIQTIFDKVQYRPEDRLTSIMFDPFTNNILLGSRKINCWFFHTQEEIKTSHEFPVSFALNNDQFDNIVSADDGGFISVWDIEDGKLISRFGNAHGFKQKITAGCFDYTQRRLVTAGKDGTVKMWNFSNGQCLTELESEVTGKKIDQEVTKLVCVFDPDDEDNLKGSYIFSVGWDRKIHIWSDEKTEIVTTNKILPQDKQIGHQDDIMSAVYVQYGTHQLIFTGGHDGSLIGWNFETGYIKKTLHDQDDKTCTSQNYIKDSKSVDQLMIVHKQDGDEDKKKSYLLSMTADQNLRFWNLDDTKSLPQPCFKFNCKHPPEDNLTALAVTKDSEILITADTSGQLKCWDISQVDFDDQKTENKFIEKYFIIAHKSLINSVQIIEENNMVLEKFIVTASNDCNINIHRLKNGVYIGQFGQTQGWNIQDMSPYDNKKPRYVRDWYLKLKDRMRQLKSKWDKQQEQLKLQNQQVVDPSPAKAQKEKTSQSFGMKAQTIDKIGNMTQQKSQQHSIDEEFSDEEQKEKDEQQKYYDKLVDELEFSEEEDEGDDKHLIKNAAQYLQYKSQKKGKTVGNRVDETKYFDAVTNLGPYRREEIKNHSKVVFQKQQMINFRAREKENQNQYSLDS